MVELLTTKRDISNELKRLVEETADLKRGAFIAHEVIEEASGIKREEKLWARLIKHWKREMLARGLYIKAAVPFGTGYRILTLDEQRISEPLNLQRQAVKRINRAAACVGAIPVGDLDEEGLKFQVARLQQLSEMKQVEQKQRAEVTSWLSNPETLPKLNGERQKIA